MRILAVFSLILEVKAVLPNMITAMVRKHIMILPLKHSNVSKCQKKNKNIVYKCPTLVLMQLIS